MTAQGFAEAFSYLAGLLFSCWILGHSRNVLFIRLRPFLRWMRQQIGPFALPLVIVRYLARVYAEADGTALLNIDAVAGLLLGASLWWLLRHDPDDDDRWKRRRQRLTRALRRGGRLVVAPAGAR